MCCGQRTIHHIECKNQVRTNSAEPPPLPKLRLLHFASGSLQRLNPPGKENIVIKHPEAPKLRYATKGSTDWVRQALKYILHLRRLTTI